jgi:hypothetical protein
MPSSASEYRTDNSGVFLARELEHIHDRVFDTAYADIKYPLIFPMNFDVSRGKESHTYRVFDTQGSMRLMGGDKVKDAPRADVVRREVTMPIAGYMTSYGYTFQEVRAAQEVKSVNLEERRAGACRRVYEETMQRVAYFGEPSRGMKGFFNNPDMDKIVPDKWFDTAGLTVDECLELLYEPATRIVNNSNQKEVPNTMLLPWNVLRIVSTMRIGVDSNMTVLSFFLANNMYITDVEAINELAASKSSGFLSKDRIICYHRHPDKLEMHLPQPLEFFDAIPKETQEWVIPAHARHGGVALYCPKSAIALEKA